MENANQRKEEAIVSKETAGKIPWKQLTILLAIALIVGVLWIAATSLATPAKTSSDLNNLEKSGSDKTLSAVNGTPTPSPTNKGQETGKIVKTSQWMSVGKGNVFAVPGYGEIVIAVSQKGKWVYVSVFRQSIDSDSKDPKKYQTVRYASIRVTIKLKTETGGELSRVIVYGIDSGKDGPLVSSGEYETITKWQPEIEVLPYVPPSAAATAEPIVMK